MRSIVAIGTLAGLTSLASAANAQSILRVPAEHSHVELEVHALVPYYYGFGVGGGARIGIPILASGFGNSFNNSFGISAGADFYYDFGYGYAGYSFYGLQFHLDAQWNVYFTPRLSAFVEVGVAPELHFWSCGGGCGGGYDTFAFWFDAAVGVRYHFGGAEPNGFPAFIARVGTSGLTVGLSF